MPRAPKSGRIRRGVNKQYFQNLLKDQQLSQRQLAKLMHRDQSAIVRGFSGKRVFTTEETADLARILNVPIEDILRNLDVDVPQMRSTKGGTVAVTGQVLAGKIEFGRPAGPRAVAAPPNETGLGLQALRYTDEGPLEGSYLYYRPTTGVAPQSIGRLCVCVVSGGETVLATPRPSSVQREVYTLRDVLGRIFLEDAWLESASPVVWIKTA